MAQIGTWNFNKVTSSLSWIKNRGSRSSVVFACPKIGARFIITPASAVLTCGFGSLTRSLTIGKISLIIVSILPDSGKAAQKSFSFVLVCARTSFSLSLSKFWAVVLFRQNGRVNSPQKPALNLVAWGAFQLLPVVLRFYQPPCISHATTCPLSMFLVLVPTKNLIL